MLSSLGRNTAAALRVTSEATSRAISVAPLLFGRHPVAAVTLAKGAETKTVSEDLD